eukprot:jgi/Hompol1/2171/HPOL_005876-RA
MPLNIPTFSPVVPFTPIKLAPLSDTEKDALAAMKARVRLASPDGNDNNIIPNGFDGEQLSQAKAFCNEACLLRYLRAHRFNVDGAAKGLRETLLWRKSYGTNDITPEDIESEAEQGNTYMNGFDNFGRPIIYIKKRGVLGDPEKNVKLVIYTLEQAIRLMPQGVERLTIVFDFTHYTRANSPPINISLMTLRVIMSHYPERLGVAYFVNAPWVFSLLWNIVQTFLDPVTKAKIHFIKCNNAAADATSSSTLAERDEKASRRASVAENKVRQVHRNPSSATVGTADNTPKTETPSQGVTVSQILTVIDPDQLEVAYGGNLDFVYDHDAYVRAYRQRLEELNAEEADAVNTATAALDQPGN